MKNFIVLFAVVIIFLNGCNNTAREENMNNDDWKLGVQAYTFKEFTFYEAIDKAGQLGLKYIEAYPSQKLSKERPDVKTSIDMDADTRLEIKDKLNDAGIKLINYGVIKLPNDEAKSRAIFEFAKDMGIETIVSEPPEDAFELIDKLCNEYKISVAIHNHPKPSRYWNPDKVVDISQKTSKWIGACADTGHWMRSGVDPVEAIKKLDGHIVSLHLKDLNEFGVKNAYDVPWGTGKANVKAVLAELKRQGFKGSFSIEYEHNWHNSVPEIAECVGYFNEVSSHLSADKR